MTLASCDEILTADPGAPSGLYMIAPPAAVQYEVYCEMTLAGGGWTAFFSGITGSPNVFAHFEDTAVTCPDPMNECLRRIPQSLPASTLFAASCGPSAASFNIDTVTLSYLSQGVQGGGWRQTSNGTALAGGADPAYVANFWTGNGTNEGWILSSTQTDSDTPATFGNSYGLNTYWDYCNGVPNTSSPMRLYYR